MREQSHRASTADTITGILSRYGARIHADGTSLVPTKEMNAYALRASLGDDVYFEPSTAFLETHVAKITGKEAGLFLPTGTMSNQVAIRTHLQQPPYSVITDARAHIYR